MWDYGSARSRLPTKTLEAACCVQKVFLQEESANGQSAEGEEYNVCAGWEGDERPYSTNNNRTSSSLSIGEDDDDNGDDDGGGGDGAAAAAGAGTAVAAAIAVAACGSGEAAPELPRGAAAGDDDTTSDIATSRARTATRRPMNREAHLDGWIPSVLPNATARRRRNGRAVGEKAPSESATRGTKLTPAAAAAGP